MNDQGTPIRVKNVGRRWIGEFEGWASEPGSLRTVVDQAHKVARASGAGRVTLKVAPETRITPKNLKQLLAANPWPRFYMDEPFPEGGPEYMDLSDCTLEGMDLTGQYLAFMVLRSTHFRQTTLVGASFVGATLQGTAFVGGNMRNVDFEEALLDGVMFFDADLRGASFRHSALKKLHVRDALLDRVDFRGSRIEDTDLDEVRSMRGSPWARAHLNGVRMRREDLGSAIGDERIPKGLLHTPGWPTATTFTEARDAYLILKNNFLQIGRYEDASWAYVKEQQLEKAAAFPTSVGHQWIRRRARKVLRRVPAAILRWPCMRRAAARTIAFGLHLALFVGWVPPRIRHAALHGFRHIHGPYERASRRRWAANWLSEITTGYGERPNHVLVLGAAIVLAFGIVYWITGALPGEHGGIASIKSQDAALNALTFSTATFATFNLADAGLQPEGRWLGIASSAEALFGILILALFVFTLGNRISRS